MKLQTFLDATPLPPSDVDADELIAAFQAMFARRQQLLDGLAEPLAVTDADREILQAIAAREAAWSKVLAFAMTVVSQHRVNTTKLRGYAPTV